VPDKAKSAAAANVIFKIMRTASQIDASNGTGAEVSAPARICPLCKTLYK
jgi:hypothetical protein